MFANSEFSEDTELWTGAVEEERRYTEGDLGTPTEGSVGRRGRDGNADVIWRTDPSRVGGFCGDVELGKLGEFWAELSAVIWVFWVLMYQNEGGGVVYGAVDVKAFGVRSFVHMQVKLHRRLNLTLLIPGVFRVAVHSHMRRSRIH